jgi:hypothetical protein
MRKVFAVLLAFSLLFVAELTFATAQAPDVLILDGKKYSVYTNPLAHWIEENPNRIPKPNVTSTGLWRGYIATFTVKEHGLYLTNIEILNEKAKSAWDMVSVMDKVFPNQKDVLADWFTGNMIIPDGKLVKYLHMGYASIYEKYLILRVEHGVVVRQAKLDTRAFLQFRDEQFLKFKQTEQYRKAFEEAQKESQKDGMKSDPKQDEEFLREFYSAEYMSMIFPEAPDSKKPSP